MPFPHPRAFPLSLFALSFTYARLAPAADTDVTTPPRIDLLSPSRTFSTASSQFTAADLDDDGDQDLVHQPQGGSDQEGDPHAYWIENLGNRQFGPLRLIHLGPTDSGQTLEGAVVWDMIGDSKPEIFVSRRMLPSISSYTPFALSPGLTEDAPAPIVPTRVAGASSIPWDLVDFDGTGNPYIVSINGAAGADQTTVRAYKRNGGSVGDPFQQAWEVTSRYFDPQDVVDFDASDVDGDGDGDLCVACSDDVMRIFEREYLGSSQFEPRLFPGVDSHSTWIDVNGDGRRDILQPDYSWHENLGNWNFTLHEPSPAHELLAYASFEKVVPRAGQSALVHAIVLNEDQTAYERIVVPFDSATPLIRETAPGDPNRFPTTLHYGDLDGDGHVDLVYAYSAGYPSYYGSRIIVTAWGSASGFSAPQQVYVGPSPYSRTFAADFNGDMLPDLVSGPDALGSYRIRYNAGVSNSPLEDGELINGLEIPGTELRILGSARIDKDKYPDLVCSYTRLPVDEDGPEQAIVVVRGRKDGSFIAPVVPAGGLVFTPGQMLDGGGMQNENFVDWDRDGDLDLVSWGQWHENVNGSFPAGHRLLVELGTIPDFLGNPATIGGTITGDIDGDRALDIISLVHGTGTGNQAPDHMLVAFNDGRGGIEETIELPIQLANYDFLGNPTMTGTAVLADLNADKRLDLWVREVTGADSLGNPVTKDRWLRNPGRRTARAMNTWVASKLPAGGDKVTPGVAFGDFDGDRKAVNLKKNSGEWLSPWGYLQSTKPGPIFSGPYDFTNGFLNLTKAGFDGGVDIDGDRDTDFIFGGGGFPEVVLYNPSAEAGKRKPVKAKAVEWLGSLPVVR
ncbi:VCBS repeat-containing protein [Haloferula sp. BvORR071]|uniref:FG-GAP repeat domain-containing protein n=1 Tax=Haloferula sp. BvORR071 TaxID=1396141 RepID=UPI000558F8B4|nr:VCBS repeat-containing protein [Haloferula sp. BvORR071]